MRLPLKLLQERLDDVPGKFPRWAYQEGLRAPSLLLGPALKRNKAGVPKRIQHRLRKALLVELHSVRRGGESFNIVREERPLAPDVCQRSKVSLLFRSQGSQRLYVL